LKFSDKVVTVTGGGNGIGRQVVLELLRRGARVAAVDMRRESLDETATLADAGEKLSTHVVDITDRTATEALPAAVLDAHGAVDGVINVAGIIQPFVLLNDLDYDVIERVINVNLYGTIHVDKAFLPHLLERAEAHLANVSSMGGYLPVPGQTIYGASKAAVKLLTEGLYAELLDSNVSVSIVFPGPVSTGITDNSGVEIPGGEAAAENSRIPTISPEEAASILLDGLEEDQLHIYLGRMASLMNVANRVAPKRSTHLIYRQMKSLRE
jgi:short-subunit dehydrogenase